MPLTPPEENPTPEVIPPTQIEKEVEQLHNDGKTLPHRHDGVDNFKIDSKDLLDTKNILLTNAQKVDLTDGGVTTLHTHSGVGFDSKVKAQQTLSLFIANNGNPQPFDFDTEEFDGLGEFDCPAQRTGSATATTANHLIDTTKNQFVPADVGRWVYNSTDKTYGQITAYNSASDVTMQNNIMASGEGYRIFGTRFTAQVTGYYQVIFQANMISSADQEAHQINVNKNGTLISTAQLTDVASGANAPYVKYFDLLYLTAGDYLEFFFVNNTASNKQVNVSTFFAIHRLS